jgi:hypothetical protein
VIARESPADGNYGTGDNWRSGDENERPESFGDRTEPLGRSGRPGQAGRAKVENAWRCLEPLGRKILRQYSVINMFAEIKQKSPPNFSGGRE